MSNTSRSKVRSVSETLAVFAATFGLCEISARLSLPRSDYSLTLVPVILILVPSIVLIFRGVDFKDYGITLRGWPNSIKEALLTMLTVLPVFFLGYYFYQTALQNMWFSPGIPRGLAMDSVYAVSSVAFPEEYFFRGYVQSEVNRVFGKKYRFLNVPFGPGLIFSSLLFAFAHILTRGDWFRSNVIFASLLFGWLREKTGGIVAPVIAHGLCNVTYKTVRGFFRFE